ncbi:MAG: hypothetical protein HYV35_01335 [Lentisphaerae bacterium]|nr:hypothetical protein [Lentisphaerota bacterium]
MKAANALLLLLAVMMAVGCAKIRDVKVLMEPTKFFANLTCDDMLPDLKHEHGDFFFTYVDPPGSSGKYPLHVMAVYKKTNETARYYYQLQQSAPGALWEVAAAWMLQTNGHKGTLRLPSQVDQLRANERISKE